MKTIHLNVIKSTIIDAVKSETFLTGLSDKAVDGNASVLAYQESAGDDAFHERKLERTLVTAADKLATLIGDYLTTETQQTTGDNAVEIDYSDASLVKFKLRVSDRFNESYTNPLARLVSKFIGDQMLVLWWSPIKEKSAAFYQQFANSDLQDIQRCFNKIAPKAPRYPYTQTLRTETDNVVISIPKDESDYAKYEAMVNYFIDEDVIDDIEADAITGPLLVDKRDNGKIAIIPISSGTGSVLLWSRHKEAETKRLIEVSVVEADE